jgi:hypothetical protein
MEGEVATANQKADQISTQNLALLREAELMESRLRENQDHARWCKPRWKHSQTALIETRS